MEKHLSKRLIYSYIGIALLLAIFAAAFLWTDFSATVQPSWLETSIASGLLSLKIEMVSPIKVAPFAPTNDDVGRGRELYHQRCGFCHGDQSAKPAALGLSLSPQSPQFLSQNNRPPAWRSVYIIRHGIRWTGMPAFRSLPEADAWRIAWFIQDPAADEHGK